MPRPTPTTRRLARLTPRLVAVGVALAAAGCRSADPSMRPAAAYDPGVIDLARPTAMPTPAAPTPAPATPLFADAETPNDGLFAPDEPAADAEGPAAGVTHTVRRGETFYALATAYYRDGRQWPRIADANPGVPPSGLRVGQSIVIP